jgi:hypothetical protein
VPIFKNSVITKSVKFLQILTNSADFLKPVVAPHLHVELEQGRCTRKARLVSLCFGRWSRIEPGGGRTRERPRITRSIGSRFTARGTTVGGFRAIHEPAPHGTSCCALHESGSTKPDSSQRLNGVAAGFSGHLLPLSLFFFDKKRLIIYALHGAAVTRSKAPTLDARFSLSCHIILEILINSKGLLLK